MPEIELVCKMGSFIHVSKNRRKNMIDDRYMNLERVTIRNGISNSP